jgi:hypothetical protein
VLLRGGRCEAALFIVLRLAQQIGQLGDIRRNPTRFVLHMHLGRVQALIALLRTCNGL